MLHSQKRCKEEKRRPHGREMGKQGPGKDERKWRRRKHFFRKIWISSKSLKHTSGNIPPASLSSTEDSRIIRTWDYTGISTDPTTVKKRGVQEPRDISAANTIAWGTDIEANRREGTDPGKRRRIRAKTIWNDMGEMSQVEEIASCIRPEHETNDITILFLNKNLSETPNTRLHTHVK